MRNHSLEVKMFVIYEKFQRNGSLDHLIMHKPPKYVLLNSDMGDGIGLFNDMPTHWSKFLIEEAFAI